MAASFWRSRHGVRLTASSREARRPARRLCFGCERSSQTEARSKWHSRTIGALYLGCMESELCLVVGPPDGEGVGVALVAQDTGSEFRLPRTTRKNAVRFAVGNPGHRGTIWRLWGVPNANDVYLASRQSAGVFKVSLHQSGDWRLQWVNQDDSAYFCAESTAPSGRIMDQWRRTPAVAGWTDALSIWTPGDELVENPSDSERWEDIQWLQAPTSGRAIELRVVILEPQTAYPIGRALTANSDALALVNGLVLPNDEVVVVLGRTGGMTTSQSEAIARHRPANRSHPDTFDLDPATGPRELVISVDNDGYRNLWDLAIQTPDPPSG